MCDKYDSYLELCADYKEYRHFQIETKYLNDKILIFTPHGGGIEGGTSELVRGIAGENLSYYIFEGVMRKNNGNLHLTSTKFDEPICINLISHCETSLAIHRCCNKKEIILLGGRDKELRDVLFETLKNSNFPVNIATGKFAGTFMSNICNRTNSGKGVQIEFSSGFLHQLFRNADTRLGRRTKNEIFERLVKNIRSVLLNS